MKIKLKNIVDNFTEFRGVFASGGNSFFKGGIFYKYHFIETKGIDTLSYEISPWNVRIDWEITILRSSERRNLIHLKRREYESNSHTTVDG